MLVLQRLLVFGEERGEHGLRSATANDVHERHVIVEQHALSVLRVDRQADH